MNINRILLGVSLFTAAQATMQLTASDGPVVTGFVVTSSGQSITDKVTVTLYYNGSVNGQTQSHGNGWYEVRAKDPALLITGIT